MNDEISNKEKLLRVTVHVKKKRKPKKISSPKLQVEDIPSDTYAETLLGKRYRVSEKVIKVLESNGNI